MGCIIQIAGIARIVKSKSLRLSTAISALGDTGRRICSSVIRAIRTSACMNSKYLIEVKRSNQVEVRLY